MSILRWHITGFLTQHTSAFSVRVYYSLTRYGCMYLNISAILQDPFVTPAKYFLISCTLSSSALETPRSLRSCYLLLGCFVFCFETWRCSHFFVRIIVSYSSNVANRMHAFSTFFKMIIYSCTTVKTASYFYLSWHSQYTDYSILKCKVARIRL
jgi:hypothetical protein